MTADSVEWVTTHGDRVEVYYSPSPAPVFTDGWRWRVLAANNKILEGGEQYTRRSAAIKAALRHHPRVEP